jgi:phospholipid/cholesterol/gamma-HCH transport system ATP-binding protein
VRNIGAGGGSDDEQDRGAGAPERPGTSPDPAAEGGADAPLDAAHDDTADAGRGSRVSVVDESRPGRLDDEYKWHTGQRSRPEGAEDAIEFIDVHKAFGRNQILRGLNMGVPENKISMILGPSGTGKSVCIKHMVGLLYPDQGDVLVHGESVPNMVDDELFDMRKKFGVLFQDGALFGSMNLFDNVAFPLRQHTDKSEREIGDIVNRRLDEVGLGDANDKMPNELSGGMRKRAGFARALVLDPDIVLFDEPDSGLDPVRTALLCELIQEIHEENGGAYVVITHDIASARRVAEYIAVLWKGRIVESGPAEELFNSGNPFVRQFLSGEAEGPLGME